MAIKFPLEMRNGVQVRNITELRENFDAEKVVGYFLEGKLKTWLDARYYEDEAGAVACLSKDDPNLAQKLCKIFGIEYAGSTEINAEEIAEKTARINRLKQYTDDDEIIRNVDLVAFDQEELAELYDKGVEKIYLCEGEFLVPKSKQGLDYVLIGNVVVTGLPAQEYDEKKENHDQQRIIEITEPIEMNSTQSKKYQDAIIHISSTIKCDGTLEFENCEIHCTKMENSAFLSSTRSTIGILGGSLRFTNCKIEYNGPDDEYRLTNWFVAGERANIVFENCAFIGCKNLAGSNKDGNISFISCTTPNVIMPMVTGYGTKKIQITACTMTHNTEPVTPEKIDTNMKGSLVKAAADVICIAQSTFEGFVGGVVCSEKEVAINSCTFIECSAIVCGRENRAKIEECNFRRCIHLFKTKDLTLIKCDFFDCFGKVEAKNLLCEHCNWNAGFVLFTHQSSGEKSTFSRCTFENIQYQNASEHLCKFNVNGYRYFYFTTEGEIEELLSIGALIHTGDFGKISVCKFTNINLGNVRFLITCESSTSLEKSTFENCVAGKEILDRTEYTCYDFTKPALFTFFDKGKKRQASYYITNCKGIHE